MPTSVILRFQSTGSIPGRGDPVSMRGPGLTIGRGQENDLVLPDPDRTLSKRHCAIEDHNGSIVVVDFSTNGTFLNYGKLALGPTPTPLNNGDVLSVGPYEIRVDITHDDPGARIADPLMDEPVSHGQATAAPSAADLLDAPGDGGDFLDDLLSGREGPVGPAGVNREDPDDESGLLPPLGEDDPLLPPAEDPDAGAGASQPFHSPSVQDHFQVPGQAGPANTIPDDWEDDLLSPGGGAGGGGNPFAEPGDGGAGSPAFIPDDFGPLSEEPEEGPAPEPVPEPAPEPVTERTRPLEPLPPQPEPEPEPTAVPAAPAVQPQGGDDAAARAFLRALGAEEVTVPDQELTSTLTRLGQVLRIMVSGMREILMTRTSIKSEFRIEQTMIQAGGNNPLKFSISPEQAIEAMVKPSAKGYLEATKAAEEALQDIKAHEIAMVTGMEAALKGVLAKLDPKALEDKITTGGGLGSVLKSKKARYWEIYETMYAEISDQAENDFHELFAREFARAYKEQLEKLQ